jgi:hypothetical protein
MTWYQSLSVVFAARKLSSLELPGQVDDLIFGV